MNQRKLGLTLLIVGAAFQVFSSVIMPFTDLFFGAFSGLAGPVLIVGGIVVFVRSSRAETLETESSAAIDTPAAAPIDGSLADNQTAAQAASRPGCFMGLLGIAFAISPLLIAAVSTQPGHNMWSEGDSASGGAAIWLMFFTLPAGGALALIGLIRYVSHSSKK